METGMSSPQLLQSMCDTFDVKGIRHGRTISNVILVGVGAAAVEGGGADGGACGCGGGRSGADGGDRGRDADRGGGAIAGGRGGGRGDVAAGA